MVKNYKRFLNKIKKLKLYLIKLNKNDIIKNKIYLSNCIIKDKNCQLIIIIIYNKYIFFINNSIYKVQTKIENIFLYPKN